jgi:hypothetical protein
MADFSTTLAGKIAYFHSKQSTLTEGNQLAFEPLYKSSHSVLGQSDVWADPINYCVDAAAADAEAIANVAVTKYLQVDLTPIPGSNNQSWYYNNAGTFVKPWISPRDIPNSVTQAPSYGFQMQLYQQNLTIIPPTAGRWNVDYYSGIVQFEVGFTPADMGWLTPIKATIYAYTGTFAASGSGGASFIVNQVAHGFPILTPIYHDGVSWVMAQSDSDLTLGTHLVVAVNGADSFTAASLGRFTITAHGLTVGEYYYVDHLVAGTLTATQPPTYSNPILYVYDVDTIQVVHYRPTQSGALGLAIAGDGVEENKEAGENIPANTVVITDLLDRVWIADNTNPAHEQSIYGITRAAVVAGDYVNVRSFGEVTDAGWAWVPNMRLYLSAAGAMVQAPPGVGFTAKVGYAITPTKILFDVDLETVPSLGSYPDFKIDCGAIIQVPTSGWVELDGGSII